MAAEEPGWLKQCQADRPSRSSDRFLPGVAGENESLDRQADGIAMSLALGGAQVLQADQRFAVSANLGHFDGANAAGFGAIGRLSGRVSFNVGADVGSGLAWWLEERV